MYVHNIWFICALINIHLSVEHIKGGINVKADLLSRLFSGKAVNQGLWIRLHRDYVWDKIIPAHLQLDLS